MPDNERLRPGLAAGFCGKRRSFPRSSIESFFDTESGNNQSDSIEEKLDKIISLLNGENNELIKIYSPRDMRKFIKESANEN